jgi:hypothetical protein
VKKKVKPIVGKQRESMILALTMDELVAGLNLAMRVRKVTLILDYTQDPFPRLYIEMPGVEKQQIMLLDQRKHCCYITPPSNRELFFAFNDITTRLHKAGGRLSLTGDKPKEGPRRALLQIYVDGATNIALTLMDTVKGKKKTDTDFQLPDGTTP